jgi:Glu-tRNA(Gln) amidotransferase subunit E-like FAD-binding protein
MAEKVRRHSRIGDELPQELKREVDRLLVEGNVTYDDIKAFLEEKGCDISRSAIGRYGKEFLASYQKLRVIEEKSRTLVSEAGDGMVLEEAAAKIFAQKIVEAQLLEGFDILENPRLIGDFAKLQSSTVARERFKRELKEKVEKTAESVIKVARQGGLSDEKAEEIRKKILGIV